jgi:hypothetical protein
MRGRCLVYCLGLARGGTFSVLHGKLLEHMALDA